MSSVLRVFKLRSYFNPTAKSFLKNTSRLERSLYLQNFKLPVQLGPGKICERTYGFQHSEPKDEFLNSSTRNLDSDFKLLDSILCRGSFLNKKTLESVITKTSDAQEITPSQAVFLLNCCGSSAILENIAARRKLVSRVWKIYEDKGIPLDISHYNAFLQILVETESDFSPLDFLATLEEKNIKPNRITYSRLIAKFCQKGDIDGANKILEHMKNNGIEITEYIFSSLILGNSRAKDLDGALQVVDIMKQSKIKLGPDTYSALIQTYAEHEKFDEIDSLLSDVKKELLNENLILEIVCKLVNHSSPSAIEKVIDCLESDENLSPSLLRQTSSLLIFSGQDELAYKLYKKMRRTDGQSHIGNFFPKLIASAFKDLSIVVKYCDDLRNNNYNILSFENALESYLQDHNFESAMALARVMKERGISLKEHYFYPVLINAATGQSTNKVFEIFEDIIRLEIPLSSEFYSNFFLPSLKVNNEPESIKSTYMRLLSYRDEINFQSLYTGFVEYLIKRFSLKVAAKFVSQNPRGVMASAAPLLADHYINNLNAEETAVILHQILPIEVRMHKDFEEEEIINKFVGIKTFFRVTVAGLRRRNLFETQMPALLKALENVGCYLLPSIIEDLTAEFGESINQDVQETLQKLSNPTLTSSSSHFKEGAEGYIAIKPSLRQRIAESETDGQFDESLNTQLLLSCIHKGNIQEVEEVLQKLKSNKIDVSPPIYLMVLSLYADKKMFDKAEEELNYFLEKFPDVQISPMKIIKFARMFTEMGRFEDAIKCVLINSPENGKWPKDLSPNFDVTHYRKSVYHTLKEFAEKSDLSTLKRMQEALLSNNFAPISLVMPSLVIHHLHQNNVDEALSCFKKIAEEHNVTAGKLDLTTACIKEEDTDRLQQILDVSNQIHGDMNTLHDLVFAFLDSGKFVQAERVLQTSGMRTRQDKIDEKCKYYLQTGKIEQLKGLIDITKNLFNINRQKLYGYLMEAYIEADDPDNSLDIWTQMQEENIYPNDELLIRLGNYLQSKGCNVPFVVPSRPVKTENFSVELREALRIQNVHEIIRLVSKGIENKNISNDAKNKILEIYLNNKRKKEASKLAMDMIVNGHFPSKRCMERLLSRLEEDAEVESLESFGKYFDKNARASYYYNSHLSVAIVNSGQAKELLERNTKLLQENSDCTIDDFTLTKNSVFKTIEKHPETYEDVLNLAEIMRKHQNDQIKNLGQIFVGTLFEHNFLTENFEELEKIYNEHLQNLDNFSIRKITSSCFKNKDTDKLEKLIEIVSRKPEGREGMKGFIYSTYIDILRENGKLEEALNFIKKSLENVGLQHYRSDSLSQLKRRVELQGLTFPFEIPLQKKETTTSSSSSSSDDEK